jgi:hypothetical protein
MQGARNQYFANNIHYLNQMKVAASNLMADDERETTGIDRKMKESALKQIDAALEFIGKLSE